MNNSIDKWSITDIYMTDKDWQVAYENITISMQKYLTYKGKLHIKDTLLDFFHYADRINETLFKVMSYTSLNNAIDLHNPLYTSRIEIMDTFLSDLESKTSFISPELASLDDEYISLCINDVMFKDYVLILESIKLERKHILSYEVEEALSTTSSYSGGFSEIHDELTEKDLIFSPIIIDGEKKELLENNYSKYIQSTKREVRKQAFDNIYNGYKSFSNTLSACYINSVKEACSELKLRNCSSYLNSSLEGAMIPESVYTTLLKNTNSHTYIIQDYYKLLRKNLNIKDYNFYDLSLSICPKNDKHFTFETQKEIILNCLAIFGDEYLQIINKAFSENWFDFEPSKNKESGGYCLDVYGVHPFILLNNVKNYDSLSTLAHELGHGVHSFLADSTQPYSKSDYSIFIAEIASTVNEILLNKYLYSKAETEEEQLFYLDNYVKSFSSTVFRQTMFSEFEYFTFSQVEQKLPMNKEILNNKYLDLINKYFGDSVEKNDLIQYEWMRIPHFYSPFYVYKYATSFVTSVYIANRILSGDEEFKQNYFTLLKSGGSDYPTKLLQKAGIDLSTDEIYNSSFKDLKISIQKINDILTKTENTDN